VFINEISLRPLAAIILFAAEDEWSLSHSYMTKATAGAFFASFQRRLESSQNQLRPSAAAILDLDASLRWHDGEIHLVAGQLNAIRQRPLLQ
jgi:hypothetical protein